MDWLDLLAVQGTLKILLQHHSSKASILQRSAFFTVQLLHPYMTTGKTIALTRRTFVGKVMKYAVNQDNYLVSLIFPSELSDKKSTGCFYTVRIGTDVVGMINKCEALQVSSYPLPKSKCLLTSWLQSPSAVILEPQKIKSATVSTVSPSISHEVMGPDAMIFVF